jgi:2-succinyl-5-enolpyruvyl-6-hydroxy-3-cyclohexene-1-carboxylate synthase
MIDLDPPSTLLGEWAGLAAETLVRNDIRDVIISPGSRSTPFVIAISARSELRTVDVLDERSAAFVALGMARATGRTVALLCTSGTAPAHWYPAIIEASLSDVPLLCMSADRPFEHTHCGAAQTIDQIALFGKHVRFFAEVGHPDPSEGALLGLRRVITQAVSHTRSPRPGPVHLNLRARKPLEPKAPQTDAELALRERVRRISELPLTRTHVSSVHASDEAVLEVADLLRTARRPWISCGPMPATATSDGTRDAIVEIVRKTHALFYAEGTSQLRFAGPMREGLVSLDGLDLALHARDAAEDAPDLLLHIGATPTSSALDRFIGARPMLPRVVVGVADWTDPHGTARAMLMGERSSVLTRLASALDPIEPHRIDRGFIERWIARDARAWALVEEALALDFSEGTIARTVVSCLPRGASLTIGNSLPVRMLDRFVRGDGASIAVHSQRGANGIDGLVSGAIGASLASGKPGALLLGDLSLLHDIGGLASALRVQTPLAIVAVQNGGGRIFEQLPVAQSAPHAMSHFITPQDVRLEYGAALFGLPFVRVSEERALREAFERAMTHGGVTLIEAIVPPHGARDTNARLLARMRDA